jgi:hypothetical protein
MLALARRATASRCRRLRRPAIETHRIVLPDDEVTVEAGIPVTTPARTLFDLAAVVREHHLNAAFQEAEVRRLTSPTSLDALVARYVLDAHDLPRPRINRLGDHGEIDATWPGHRLIVECDGFATHGTGEVFEEDRARDRALQVAGWRVIGLTWRQLTQDPDTIARQLSALLSD